MFEKLKGRGMSAIDLVYFAVVVIVGVVIYSSFDTQLGNMWPATTYNTTPQYAAYKNTSANTYGGFSTISVGPTIIAAVIILGIVGLIIRH